MTTSRRGIVEDEALGASPRRSRLTLLYSRAQIDERVRALARRIDRDYRDLDLVVIGVLTGAFVFVADLIRAFHVRASVDFVALSSYGAGTESSGSVTMTKPLTVPIEGRDVLVVEDILDTGRSMASLLADLRTQAPRSLRLCVLLDKPERRVERVRTDYVGFTVGDAFVVGYGIDHAGDYRHLDAIYRLDLGAR